jgi:hypothetical protein
MLSTLTGAARMAKKPPPQMSDYWNPIRQIALELRLCAEVGKPITPDRLLEMSQVLDASTDALSDTIIKARTALTYGAGYDPSEA